MNKIRITMIILILAIIISFQVGVAAEYKLNTGDRLYISVWGHSDLQQEVVVGPDGQISFPLVGKIDAEGLTVNRLVKKLTQKLQKYIKTNESRVNVVIRNYKKIKVMVLGEVKKPGAYQIVNDNRVLDLISMAGGTTKIADLKHVRLTRGNKSLSIDLKALLKGKVQGQNYKLQSGDTLYVSKGIIKVNVLGAVGQPGRYEIETGTGLREILAQAGDITPEASNKVKYISGKKKRILNLERLLKEGEENLVLHDGDTIYVLASKYNPHKLSFWKDFFFFVGGFNEVKDLFD
ncbi:polysaccharide biosynthesis/export family protein [Sporohalobacter salinus]|uniref:polysaccharide biosynthesis/export family protein n=1 Tax=Sporohalobacter salinus TaxID=1494606 RepID=UPI00195F7CB3|nr:polysaccharide biosynthesis/export family protein [Sporohalobacter salinus]MBM7622986.1 polysaccharide export outer membrane protein [Sporohalobacter salinus]